MASSAALLVLARERSKAVPVLGSNPVNLNAQKPHPIPGFSD
ncbi:MAG: hypothetical protein ACLU4N_19095 [Butyricimonas faecihominis]